MLRFAENFKVDETNNPSYSMYAFDCVELSKNNAASTQSG